MKPSRPGLFPLAFLATLPVTLAAVLVTRHSPFSAETWIRWDSGLYLGIAERGYELVTCASIHYPTGTWCGNTGWFPAYPALIRATSWLGVSLPAAAAALPQLFFLLMLAAGESLLPPELSRSERLFALLFLAFFPGCAYFHAAFPVSLALLGIFVYLGGLRARRPLLTVAGGALAGLAYHTAFLAAAGPLLVEGKTLVLGREEASRKLGWLAAAGSPLLATAGVFALQFAQTGSWTGFFLVREKYGFHELPLATLYASIAALWRERPGETSWFCGLQTLVVAGLCAFFAARAMRGKLRAPELTVVVSSLALWIFPHLLGGNASFYRGEALVCPLFLLAPQIPRWARAPLLGLFLALALQLGVFYFNGDIV
jgi:hypothetical protein